MAEAIPVIMVNHAALEMAVAPDELWRVILNDYVDARKFSDSGAIEPLSDPAAVHGGYRMRLQHGDVIDERIVRITERDEAARRLSAVADYLSVPGGMRVFATYHAQEHLAGARFTIDCHTELGIAVPAEQVAATLAEMTAGADAHLFAYLESVKARVEEAS